jgi:Ala-tRNA(Pro) deacylase
MLASKLKTFLDHKGVPYTTLPHEPAYTAQGVAARAHVHGWELAKSVVLSVDGTFVLAVLPAPVHVDLEHFRAVTGAKNVVLATEEEFKSLFPGCDVGAMPPFGNLYGLPVYVEERLTRDPSIVFNAGTHSDAVRMDYADFARLVQPKVLRFGRD